MNKPVLTEEYCNHFINIYYDEDAESPDEWDNTDDFLVYSHRQFTVTRKGFEPINIFQYLDKKKFIENHTFDVKRLKELNEELAQFTDYSKDYYIWTVYAYIHSEVSLSLHTENYDKWDTSTTGYLLVKKELYNEKEALQIAEDLIELWNQYLSGDVYRYEISTKETCVHCGHTEEKIIDSYGGLYGHKNDFRDIIEEAKCYINNYNNE